MEKPWLGEVSSEANKGADCVMATFHINACFHSSDGSIDQTHRPGGGSGGRETTEAPYHGEGVLFQTSRLR